MTTLRTEALEAGRTVVMEPAPVTGGATSPETMLALNLALIARRSPRAAERIRHAPPRNDIEFAATDEPGAPSAAAGGRWLASRRRPREEARRFAEAIDIKAASAIAVLGFGLGYHAEALVHRLRRSGIVIVFEPDVSLLRAVLERIDCTPWLAPGNVVLAVDPSDGPSLTASLHGLEAFVAAGMTIVRHPPSEPRLGESAAAFSETLARTVGAMRTHIITTMVQSDVTIRNALMNLDAYAGRDESRGGTGLADLSGLTPGAPAVVVSAGPSLARNIALLEDPRVRERCVIIAVQTVLRPLLARGIRPHFVTALDHHEISRRFYEGLTADDVRGVTLVAEPKANAAIIEAFPGGIRLAEDEFIHALLGTDLHPALGRIRPGATVAHLGYYLARHLGCDPVLLAGQDLAFTDGQYYGAGAAIHDTWAAELNEFNTLEMMEWQRIVRMRGNLHEARDHLGRRVYTDDQMAAYLAQFERDFLADAEQGRVIIDATEGGVAKAHTTPMALGEAIERFVLPRAPLPPIPGAARLGDRDPARIGKLKKRLARVRADVRRIAGACAEARGHLERMLEVQHDTARVNSLITKTDALREQVKALEPAWTLVQKLNQAGSFKRFKADRAIELDDSLTPLERQRRQIERDITNVRWLADTAAVLDDLLGASIGVMEGRPRRTRDVLPGEEPEPKHPGGAAASPRAKVRAAAVVLALGGEGFGAFMGRPAMRRTIERIRLAGRVVDVVVVTDQAEAVRRALGEGGADLLSAAGPRRGVKVIEVAAGARTPLTESIRRARAFTPFSWRGGVAGLTCYDETLDAPLALRAIDELGADAAVVLGPGWCLIDPALVDAVVERHCEQPAALPLTFTQAPPGLAPAVVGRGLLAGLAEGQRRGDALATIGGLLGYTPHRPRSDPVARPCCVQLEAGVRGCPWRFVADEPDTPELEAALREAGIDPAARGADAAAVAAAVERWMGANAAIAPRHITLELLDEAGRVMDEAVARREIETLAPSARTGSERQARGTVTLAAAPGSGHDAMDHPAWARLVARAKSLGVPVHARTMLAREHAAAEACAAAPDILSIDCVAADGAAYAALTGRELFDHVLAQLDHLVAERAAGRAAPAWIVPRITRRDEVYEHVEPFYDRALIVAGAAVIDPPPVPIAGARIAPLPLPAAAARRNTRVRRNVHADGSLGP